MNARFLNIFCTRFRGDLDVELNTDLKLVNEENWELLRVSVTANLHTYNRSQVSKINQVDRDWSHTLQVNILRFNLHSDAKDKHERVKAPSG